MKPFFIAIEGVDGTGKSTLCRNLASAVNGTSFKTPGSQFEKLRTVFDEVGTDQTGRFLFYLSTVVAASQEISRAIRSCPAICDRYVQSTLCYHRVAGVNVEIVDLASLPLVVPTLSVCLVASRDVRCNRIKCRGDDSTERSPERQDFLDAVSDQLIDCCEWALDTSDLSPDEVLARVLGRVGRTGSGVWVGDSEPSTK